MADEVAIPQKPLPYAFDLGHLLVNDANPLPPINDLPSVQEKEAALAAVARDNAQALITQLLKACPITRNNDDQALQITLPDPSLHLPREKPVPKEKEKTKWEKFAAKKGIKDKGRDERKKMVYDEAKGDWVPKWGYKGKKTEDEDWLVEVDEKKERREAQAEAEKNAPKPRGGVRGPRVAKGGKDKKGRKMK
ncbi:hypothetical protein MBLNU230_g5969t1 [Neophaeotheca triangularis]